ncbi:toll-like receptor 13 isoform X1 [Drosophila willistoni]|uniref:toll-like receptor 13 isoform X1 n=1 Tax=Drosophila willistoni TaxID=7260 RepID=UPI00017D6918|nr:toll-like receptor 13 isoform X1 [Drosophila willistoni]
MYFNNFLLIFIFVFGLLTIHGRLVIPSASSKVLDKLGISNFDLETDENDSGQETESNSESRESDDETDLKSILLKYDTDDGNSCLLDLIKDEILWWTYPNGSLKEVNLKYSKNLYLDMSHGNLGEDVDLLQQTELQFRFLGFRKVEIFSAAFNQLSSVPYDTLGTIRKSLKYLSLRGNAFSDILPDAEAFERFLNETRYETANNNNHNQQTQHECEQILAMNNTDLYNRECILYNNNNNNTNTNTNTHISQKTYEDFLRYYVKQLQLLGRPKKQTMAWATFPKLPRLIELDISNCSIEYISKETFQNITNLRRLFMSNNKIMAINGDTFDYIQKVQYLDLSFTNVLSYNYQWTKTTLEMIVNLVYGLKVHQNTFKLLPELVYLDLSHSKMTRNSAVAFTHLGNKLRYLSLCYTAFPMVSSAIFKNTALEGLDLSGNPFISYNIIDDAFDGIADTLQYLYFERSNLKNIAWSRPLAKLRVLGLAGNNINALSPTTFEPLESLQLLDLSSNHVGNWYRSVFSRNSALRFLNLRSNNINVLTSEMLKDFETLSYLSLGENNFICSCLLRDIIEVAAGNNKDAECSYNLFNRYELNESYSNLTHNLWLERYVPQLTESYHNLLNYKRVNQKFKLRFFSQLNYKSLLTKCPAEQPYQLNEFLNDTTLKFQLLDYDAQHYWCFNETDQVLLVDQLNCQSRTLIILETELHSVTTIVIAVVASIAGISMLALIIYLKRWHIHYYYSSLKSAALLSSASKENPPLLTPLQDPNVVYDIFISYCQNDRSWVLEELLPNVEETGDISICLHERDFQIGVTILDNIISCMDRSHSLMLIISSKFLLSHWCQFEMYLAQHRIFEVSKEHLILVFLEDIPRSKRPKTLQYLMDVKTYIKWPAGKGDKQPKLEERKLFWKRLRKSLEAIGIHSTEWRL